MICLEKKEKEKFIVFSCKHKTCDDCFPLLVVFSTPCPMCEEPITRCESNEKLTEIETEIESEIEIKTKTKPSYCIEYCKIVTGTSIMSLLIFYIVNYAFQRN